MCVCHMEEVSMIKAFIKREGGRSDKAAVKAEFLEVQRQRHLTVAELSGFTHKRESVLRSICGASAFNLRL